ncbi:phospholipase-like protein [Tanacetum coccineum]
MCDGGVEIYGVPKTGNLRFWYCNYDNERKNIKGKGLSFPDFLLAKYGKSPTDTLVWDNRYAKWCDISPLSEASSQESNNPRPRDYTYREWTLIKVGHTDISEPVKKALLKLWLIDCFQDDSTIINNPTIRSFDDYKWEFDLEIDKLADEYELGIGKKGHILDNIWEYCNKVHNNSYGWHNHGFEEEERDEIDLDDVLPLGRKNGSKFKEMIRKEGIKSLLEDGDYLKFSANSHLEAMLREFLVLLEGKQKSSGGIFDNIKYLILFSVKCSKPINRGLIQSIPTSLTPRPFGEAIKASNLRRKPPGVQGRSHFTYLLYLIVQIRILSYGGGVVKHEIGGNVNFKIKSQFMRELREDTFSGNKDEDAHDHIDRVLSIVRLFNIPGVSNNAVILRMFVYPVDFMILDIKEDKKKPLILGTPFLTTAKAEIKFDKGTICLKYGKSTTQFHISPDPFLMLEEREENKINTLSIVNKRIFEWEKRIRFHHEIELEFEVWKSKNSKEKTLSPRDDGTSENKGGVT